MPFHALTATILLQGISGLVGLPLVWLKPSKDSGCV
jgi:hypothetical protein